MARSSLAVLLAFVAGVLTSFGQTYLPEQLSSLANSSGSWCAVALLLALLPRPQVAAVATGALALLALLAGYEVTSVARGYAVALSTVAEWVLAAIAVGPFLGIGGHGLAVRRAGPAVAGSSVLAGVLIGEGVYGLTVVAATTSPVYWTISLVAGLVVPALVARRLGSARTLLAAYALTAVVALAFYVAYQVAA